MLDLKRTRNFNQQFFLPQSVNPDNDFMIGMRRNDIYNLKSETNQIKKKIITTVIHKKNRLDNLIDLLSCYMARWKIIDKIGVGVVKINNVNDRKVLESVVKHVMSIGCSMARGFPPEVAGVEEIAEVAAE